MNFDLEEGDDANKFKVLKGFIVQKHFPLNKFFLAVYLLGSLRSLLLIYIYISLGDLQMLKNMEELLYNTTFIYPVFNFLYP